MESDTALVQDENWNIKDNNRNIINDLYKKPLRKESLSRCGYSLDLSKPYFNDGVIWIHDTEFAHFFHR